MPAGVVLLAVAAYLNVSFSPLSGPVLEKTWLPYVLVVFVPEESSMPYCVQPALLYGAVATVLAVPAVTQTPKAAVPAVIVCGVVAPLATAGIFVQLVPPLLLRPAQVAELVVFKLTFTPPEALVEV